MSKPNPSPAVFGYAHVLPVYGIDRLVLQPFLAPGITGLEGTLANQARELERATYAIETALDFIRQALGERPNPGYEAALDSLPALDSPGNIHQARELLDDFLSSPAGMDVRYPSPQLDDPDLAVAGRWVGFALDDLFLAARASEYDLPLHKCYQAATSAARACGNAGATLKDHLRILTEMQAIEIAVEALSPDLALTV